MAQGRGRPPKGSFVDNSFPELLEYWNLALGDPKGIRIESKRPNALLQKLYAARRECGHNAYDAFKLVERPDAVLIVRRV
jgi:hypothetical protein